MTWLVPKRGGADSAMMVPAMLSPPKADGSQAWHHKQGRGVRGREVIQRGIHLVRAGRRQRHAVHEDLHTVGMEASHLGHAGWGPFRRLACSAAPGCSQEAPHGGELGAVSLYPRTTTRGTSSAGGPGLAGSARTRHTAAAAHTATEEITILSLSPVLLHGVTEGTGVLAVEGIGDGLAQGRVLGVQHNHAVEGHGLKGHPMGAAGEQDGKQRSEGACPAQEE